MDTLRFTLAGETFILEPLFRQGPDAALGMAADATPQWYVADSLTPLTDKNAWEMAHAAVETDLGFGPAGSVAYAEPDLLQKFDYPAPPSGALAETDDCSPTKPNANAPDGPEFAWHLRDDYAQLRQARAAVNFADGIRIGHLDTGYDPNHVLLPVNLKKTWGRDFAENGRTDATDPDIGGLLQNPGHGTGTVCLLAGNKLNNIEPVEDRRDDFYGGAPLAEIVPVRIANSVILFRNSAFARGLEYLLAPGEPGQESSANRVDVVSVSMGGLASGAWADIVNRAYEMGVVVVAAAGNGKPGGFPTRNIVYPARFNRVIAACGIMANRKPYAFLPNGEMEGNFGPESKMKTAVGAFTPNVPWAKIGCDHKIVDLDGAGTSSATPQVAAAAALWLAKHKNFDFGPEAWRRVEAVRKALFEGADKSLPSVIHDDETLPMEHFIGNGALRANNALATVPDLNLPMQPKDSASFAFLRVLTGLGVAANDDARQRMFDLEVVQLTQTSPTLEKLVPDPDVAELSDEKLKSFVEAVIVDPRASSQLRLHLIDRYTEHFGKPQAAPAAPDSAPTSHPVPAMPVPRPTTRNLRGFAFDPSLSVNLDTARLNQALFEVPWEDLKPGPEGEYLHVVDESSQGKPLYEPVDLDHPHILAQDGLSPSQGNPQFHQQQVYAVARTTIQYFEGALGRPVLWTVPGKDEFDDSVYRGTLKILPHAMQDTNAFYSPNSTALLFGYFDASKDDPGGHYPGGRVYTCLSHDIVAHETTHAILDGIHRRFREPSNADVLAFHEGFADIVALFQHFALPEALEAQVAKARGDLKVAGLLSDLAREFGAATGKRGALRSGIGAAEPKLYATEFEVHTRGSILVAAVFEAFLSIYQRRADPILRLATAGTGVLPPGDIPGELARALAAEASATAEYVLKMCIRALDYTPPVDMTFGEYLRALVTADFDFAPNDDLDARTAFIVAFRRRALYPSNLGDLSVDSLLWPQLSQMSVHRTLLPLMDGFRTFANDSRYAKRPELFQLARQKRWRLHEVELPAIFNSLSEADRTELGDALGLDFTLHYEIHSLRVANRIRGDGNVCPQIVLEVTQSRDEFLTVAKNGAKLRPFKFRSGATLIVDLDSSQVRYAIRKKYNDELRLKEQKDFLLHGGKAPGAAYFEHQQFRIAAEPFRLLHREPGL